MIASIIIMFFTKIPTEDFTESVGEITGFLLVITVTLLILPFILKRLVGTSDASTGFKCVLYKIGNSLKCLHVALGSLLVGLVILHLISNFMFESLEWDMEVVTGILVGLALIPTIIYAILNKFTNCRYLKPHIIFSIVTTILIIVHLID